MKKSKYIRLVIIALGYLAISTLFVSGMDTPYLCSECQRSFPTEALLVSHINEAHGIGLQISGTLQQYDADTENFEIPQYLPVAFYICPETGLGFFTEAQLCWHLQSQ